MKTPARPIGQDPQSQMLWYVSKQLEELQKIISSSSGGSTTALEDIELSVDELKTASTDGSQKTQIVGANGNNLNVSGTPLSVAVEFTRPNDTDLYAANDNVNSSTSSPAALNFANVVLANGGGGFLTKVKVEAPTAWSGSTLRLWFFNAIPTSIPNDNAAYVNLYANNSKRLFYVDIFMGTTLGASDIVFGQEDPFKQFKCASEDTDLYLLVQTLTSVTPTAEDKINITLDTLALT